MASSYKYLNPNDRVVSTTELTEEVLHVSGAVTVPTSYTYYAGFDSSSLHVFDIAFGRSSDTANVAASASNLQKEKSIYNQFAKTLIGHAVDNTILKFGLDANDDTSDNVLHNAFFLNFSRSQFKDKIKKGTFNLQVQVSGTTSTGRFTLTDKSGTLGPTVRECETGEVGLLYVSGSDTTILSANAHLTGGLLFYEAGVAVISPYIFSKYNASNPNPSSSLTAGTINSNVFGLLGSSYDASGSLYNGKSIENLVFSGSLSEAALGLGKNTLTASYQAVNELNSTIYFCRAFNNEFNYSSNPTYLNESQIYTKNGDPTEPPVSYITTVGLYSDDNQLLAVAKLSEPIKKTPETELIARVRLDF